MCFRCEAFPAIFKFWMLLLCDVMPFGVAREDGLVGGMGLGSKKDFFYP